MSRWGGAAAVVAIVLALLGAALAAERSATVVAVTDADTLVVRLGEVEEPVRLIGIDAPERGRGGRPGEYLAEEATRFVGQLVLGGRVRLEEEPGGADRDRYGRLLRYVHLRDGRLLNAELLRAGYAFAYTRFRFSRMDEFRGLEERARAAGVGLWSRRSLAELAWVLEHGAGPVLLYPMSNRSWAVRLGSHAKLRVRASELARTLDRARQSMADVAGDELVRALERSGWVRISPAEEGRARRAPDARPSPAPR